MQDLSQADKLHCTRHFPERRVQTLKARVRFRPQFGAICLFAASAVICAAQSNAPLPDPRQLMRDVVSHQKQLDKVRENYTYSSQLTQQDLDSNGRVTKTETTESENFFVNGHAISRQVKKDGKPLSDHDEKKETERVTKQVEKAEKT